MNKKRFKEEYPATVLVPGYTLFDTTDHGMIRTTADAGTIQPYHASVDPSRNDPCPCGSGKKYKNCCLGGK